MSRLELLLAYLAARGKEPTTWRGLAAVASLAGMRVANFDLDACVAVSVLLDGALKILLPDAARRAAQLTQE
jgi:hypothetical protein